MSRQWLHKTEFIDHHRLSRQQTWTLPASASIYVAFPDSRFPEALDLRIQRTLMEQLSRHFPLLDRGQRPQTHAAALQQAYARGRPFMVYPQLLVLRDKANSALEMDSGDTGDIDIGRDRLQVQLLIFDSINRRMLDSTIISSRSSWLAWQQQVPEDMLGPAFAKFAQSLSATSSHPL